MVKFVCADADCVNADVEYFFSDDSPTAECGGCKVTLQAIPSDMEPIKELVPVLPKETK